MILLRRDCLEFEQPDGESVPRPASQVTIELLGPAAKFVDEAAIEHAAHAVLYYFKEDLGRTSVTLGEFCLALESALRAVGLEAKVTNPDAVPGVAETDLAQLAREADHGFELAFFRRLRDEVRRQLGETPPMLRFRGLRGCVKQLIGAKRWSARCQGLNDHIVDYLRGCLGAEARPEPCALLVR